MMTADDLDPTAPLCPCGIRDCENYRLHSSALVGTVPLFRMRSRGARRHQRKARR